MQDRLPHRTLSSAIVEQLRRAILDGTHAAGTQLRQDALAAAYQVSRIPVREALFQLEAEGLVRIEPHKGAIVAAFSLEEIDDVFQVAQEHYLGSDCEISLDVETQVYRKPLPTRTSS